MEAPYIIQFQMTPPPPPPVSEVILVKNVDGIDEDWPLSII